MIESFKGRAAPRSDEEVKIHRNLNDRTGRHVWSITVRRDGKEQVVGYAPALTLEAVRFRVRPSGHAAALASGQRNVHAYAVGRLTDPPQQISTERQVSYNPFRGAAFTDLVGDEVSWAVKAVFDPQGRVWIQ